ncbi:MAG: hypothetical protein HY552_05915 [Elusimicrobia bacterium]|nr:hypothetical protein [Elusimicrobiota bacterium]
MRVLLLLALVSNSAWPATPASVEYQDIPTRYDLPGDMEADPGSTVDPNLPSSSLARIICTDENLQRRVDAIRRLSRLREAYPPDLAFFEDNEARLIVADCLMADATDLKLRRIGIFTGFSRTYSSVASSLPYHSEDPRLWHFWDQVESVRRRGLSDRDSRLKEYFERYVSMGKDPDWMTEMVVMQAATTALIERFPRLESELRFRLNLILQTQEAQEKVRDHFLKDAEKHSPAKYWPQFRRANEQNLIYRSHVLWTNIYPKALIELLGQKEAAQLSLLKVKEVKLGWPDYRRR